MKLLRAACVAPMSAPPVRDGGVVIDGDLICDVGPAGEMARAHPDAEVIDLGDALLLPGLVNAHTHLELSDMSAVERQGSFAEWIMNVIRTRAAMGVDGGPAAAEAARLGAAESLGFGVTTVGDIGRLADDTRPALAGSPLRVVSFGEVQAMAGRRDLLAPRLAAATDLRWDDWDGRKRLKVAVSPHAPYSVEPGGYRACLDWSRRAGRPITTHLAETPDESAFLADHAGPLMAIWRMLGDWRDDVPRFAGGPIRFAKMLGLLDEPLALLAHVNYVDDDELALLAAGRASVVWCPRTHAYFGHPPHRFAEMLAAGVNVCVGTDSRASSPDLNIVDDLRLVRRDYPNVSPATLWEMVTTRPAGALGVGDRVGSIAAGKWADFAVFAGVGRAADPLAAALEDYRSSAATWVAGELVLADTPACRGLPEETSLRRGAEVAAGHGGELEVAGGLLEDDVVVAEQRPLGPLVLGQALLVLAQRPRLLAAGGQQRREDAELAVDEVGRQRLVGGLEDRDLLDDVARRESGLAELAEADVVDRHLPLGLADLRGDELDERLVLRDGLHALEAGALEDRAGPRGCRWGFQAGGRCRS